MRRMLLVSLVIAGLSATALPSCGGLATAGGGGTEGTGGAEGGGGQAGSHGSTGGGSSTVTAIYMATDSGGIQHRDLFFTDAPSIYCVVVFSSGKQEGTIDFNIVELGGPGGATPAHRNFAGGTKTPGPGTDTPVAFFVPRDEIQNQATCLGRCVTNGTECPHGDVSQGTDSAGPGATCCFNPFGEPATCPARYPVGTFQCVVQIDGVRQSEAPAFQIK